MLCFDYVSPLPATLSSGDLSVLATLLSRALKIKAASSVSLSFVSERRMQAINKQERRQNHPTDVLSFATATEMRAATPKGEMQDLGDLFLCPIYAYREARRRGIEAREELARLLIHGVLHIQGYDHATKRDELQMFGLQERLVEEFNARSS
jgi:probable rRNA maturation factor